jgi:phage-related protein
MNQLNKPIRVRLLHDAEEYFAGLDKKTKEKFLRSFEKTEMGTKGKWFEPLSGSNGIWEFRIRDQYHFYRMLAFWDKTESSNTLILGTHGFNKKTNKTPKQEIQKAEKLKSI